MFDLARNPTPAAETFVLVTVTIGEIEAIHCRQQAMGPWAAKYPAISQHLLCYLVQEQNYAPGTSGFLRKLLKTEPSIPDLDSRQRFFERWC
jgi:hypothetical protein